jgi:hypothetical protein
MNNILHIITPLFRYENLIDVYNSLKDYENIIWHVSKSNKITKTIDDIILSDPRIKIYNVDCEDNEPFKKRIEVLNNIQNGYFCFLDDDTIFHENMYKLFQEKSNENFVGMVVGRQLSKNGKLRLDAQIPKLFRIDVGNVLSHTLCLNLVKWPIDDKCPRDGVFWKNVYIYYNRECQLVYETISNYNFLKK